LGDKPSVFPEQRLGAITGGMSEELRVGVVGVGALGARHARIYAELAKAGKARFAGVFDTEASRARETAARYGTRAFDSLDALIGECHAVSVVTPTRTHYEIARKLLEADRHVLLEKPMTDNREQAEELVRLASRLNLVLQVGHVERFNPVYHYLRHHAADPRFIEAHRLSPYPARSTDIGVVLDLMIHDLDIVLNFVDSPLVGLDAVGVGVLSDSEDIANVRLRFANGCAANLTASRVSAERMRKIRVFSGKPRPAYISLDYMAQSGYIYRLAEGEEEESSLVEKLIGGGRRKIVSRFGDRRIVREPAPVSPQEPLRLELESFVECVRRHGKPEVSGETAKRALDLALEITEAIRRTSPGRLEDLTEPHP